MNAMLEISNLRKAYHGMMVLDGVDLYVAAGEVAAILGPSGSGKTTLLRCLNYLERADAGTMTFAGETFDMPSISSQAIARIRQKTAFVFQNFNLFLNKTALQNVTEGLIIGRKMPKLEAQARGREALAKVGLAERSEAYPQALSGGQQQRVAIARALVTEPEIIFFDEPTSALDPELTDEVLSVIRQLADEGLTMLIVTHELAFARQVANQVIFMERGVIVEAGEAGNFFAQPQMERARTFLRRLNQEAPVAKGCLVQ